jgi:hypothetical protein
LKRANKQKITGEKIPDARESLSLVDPETRKQRKENKRKKTLRDDRESLSLVDIEALPDGICIIVYPPRPRA